MQWRVSVGGDETSAVFEPAEARKALFVCAHGNFDCAFVAVSPVDETTDATKPRRYLHLFVRPPGGELVEPLAGELGEQTVLEFTASSHLLMISSAQYCRWFWNA